MIDGSNNETLLVLYCRILRPIVAYPSTNESGGFIAAEDIVVVVEELDGVETYERRWYRDDRGVGVLLFEEDDEESYIVFRLLRIRVE